MSENDFEHIVYSKNVIEFVTVANEFCLFIESTDSISREDFVSKIQKILPLLYLKATLIPKIESTFEEVNEKFVTEEEWNLVHKKLATKLGKFDDYLEVFDPLMAESDKPIVASISENLSDIYQDIKDFLMLYRIGTLEYMNDGLWECYENFLNYWGQKLVNVLRAIHNIRYNVELNEEDEFINLQENKDINTDDWIISKRHKEYGKDYE